MLTTSGVLLLADAGLTLAWQEPVSAVIGWRSQSALEDKLAALPAPGGGLGKRALEAAAKRALDRSSPGDPLGRIELPTLDRKYVFVEGTDEASLRKGPAHYPDTPLPGQPGTVALAGHRTTYLAPFRTIDRLERDEPITLKMPYATFTYEVERQEIVAPTQTSVTKRVGHDRLVLSACHPLYSAAQRIIIFARLTDVQPA